MADLAGEADRGALKLDLDRRLCSGSTARRSPPIDPENAAEGCSGGLTNQGPTQKKCHSSVAGVGRRAVAEPRRSAAPDRRPIGWSSQPHPLFDRASISSLGSQKGAAYLKRPNLADLRDWIGHQLHSCYMEGQRFSL
jgi:hypothetical protein